MRLSASIAVALGWITSASAFGVPDVLQKLEQKLPTRDAPPPKYFSKFTLMPNRIGHRILNEKVFD